MTVAMEDCKEYYENLIKTINERKTANPLCDFVVIHFGINKNKLILNLKVYILA